MAGGRLGLRVLALPPLGPLSKQSFGNRAAVPEEGVGWEWPHSPHTGPWRSPCVSRTAALAGGTALGSDLSNSMVSRVPATLATCPCHSPEAPSSPCSPVSVSVQAPPPWEGWLHACTPSGSEDPYWAASGPLGLWSLRPPAPLSSPLCPPHPVPGAFSGVSSQAFCRGLVFQLLPLKGS